MQRAVELLWFVAALGVVEALIKPIAKQVVQRQVLRVTPLLLERLDAMLPLWLGDCDGRGLEERVRGLAEELTGEDWSGVDLTPLWERFDPRVTAERHAHR
jgi:hypothetical protein